MGRRALAAPLLEREDRILDVPDVLHHGYPEVVALPAGSGESEVDDEFPGEGEEHHHRDGVGEEAGGGSAGEERLAAGCDGLKGRSWRNPKGFGSGA